jgi:hypothetical protein
MIGKKREEKRREDTTTIFSAENVAHLKKLSYLPSNLTLIWRRTGVIDAKVHAFSDLSKLRMLFHRRESSDTVYGKVSGLQSRPH